MPLTFTVYSGEQNVCNTRQMSHTYIKRGYKTRIHGRKRQWVSKYYVSEEQQ